MPRFLATLLPLAVAALWAVEGAAVSVVHPDSGFGGPDGRYEPFRPCVVKPLPGIEEADAAALLDLALNAPETHRYTWLMKAVRAFAVNGRTREAGLARAALDRPGLEYPEQRILTSVGHLTDKAETLARHCLQDKARDALREAEDVARAAPDAGARLQGLGSVAFRRARIEGENGLAELEALGAAIVQTEAALGKPLREARRFLAMAFAESGRFDRALALALASNTGSLIGSIAQVAVQHGAVDTALALVQGRADKDDEWRPFHYARFAILDALAAGGRGAEVREWAFRWQALEGDRPINIDRLLALALARTDPAAALAPLSPRDVLFCRNVLAGIAARAGKPDAALLLLDARVGDDVAKLDFQVTERDVRIQALALKEKGIAADPAEEARTVAPKYARRLVQERYAAAAVEIAEAMANDGRDRDAATFLSGALETVQGFDINVGIARSIALGYARLGHPDAAWDFLKRYHESAGVPLHDDRRHPFWIASFEGLARRMKIRAALVYPEQYTTRPDEQSYMVLDSAGDRRTSAPLPYAYWNQEPCAIIHTTRY